jgi:hypothetical protein
MFRGKDDQLQLHLSTDGGFWTGRNDKKLRMALVEKDQQQQQQNQQQQGAQQQQQKATGQTQQRKKDSSQFHEINGSMSVAMNKRHQTVLDDKEVGIEVHNNKNVYLGKLMDKGSFLQVMLSDGSISKNVFALVGGAVAVSGKPSPVQVLQREVAELRARIKALEAANERRNLRFD